MKKCYLIAKLNDECAIMGVTACGEPPWEMTKRASDEWLVVMEARGDSYADALSTLEQIYPQYMPRLAAKFPLKR